MKKTTVMKRNRIKQGIVAESYLRLIGIEDVETIKKIKQWVKNSYTMGFCDGAIVMIEK